MQVKTRELRSDNVRQLPPFRRGVLGGCSALPIFSGNTFWCSPARVVTVAPRAAPAMLSLRQAQMQCHSAAGNEARWLVYVLRRGATLSRLLSKQLKRETLLSERNRLSLDDSSLLFHLDELMRTKPPGNDMVGNPTDENVSWVGRARAFGAYKQQQALELGRPPDRVERVPA
jgi:hypothetical protein